MSRHCALSVLFACVLAASTAAAPSRLAERHPVVTAGAAIALDQVLAKPYLLRDGGRALLQVSKKNTVQQASDTLAAQVTQIMTPDVLRASVAADAAILRAMKAGDKRARKNAMIRYYWLIACDALDNLRSVEVEAAQQRATTSEWPAYAAGGVAQTRNNVLKASLALAKAKPANKERCFKYIGQTMSAGYQARRLGVGKAQLVSEPAFWRRVWEILADDLDKLMPLGIRA